MISVKWSNIIQDNKSEMGIPDWSGNLIYDSTCDNLEPIDYFYNFFDNDVMDLICNKGLSISLVLRSSKNAIQ